MEYLIIGILALISGLADGLADRLSTPGEFASLKPYVKLTKWGNDKVSTWLNKYKNNDPEQGPAFVGSTGPFVFVTDAWHFFSFIQRFATLQIILYLMLACFCWSYLTIIIMMLSIILMSWAGFYITYNLHKWIELWLSMKTIQLNK